MVRQRLVNPVLMWAIVVFGMANVFQFISPAMLFSRNVVSFIVIVLAFLYWLYFFTGALRVHHKAVLSVAKIDKVITSGVYGIVRHPIYSADIVLAWGVFFFWPDIRVLFSVLWLTVILFLWMKIEERALEEKFGQAYTHYKHSVPMIVPRFHRSVSKK